MGHVKEIFSIVSPGQRVSNQHGEFQSGYNLSWLVLSTSCFYFLMAHFARHCLPSASANLKIKL